MSVFSPSRAYARADHSNARVLFFKVECKPLIYRIEIVLTRFSKSIESTPKLLIKRTFVSLARVRLRGIGEFAT